jgi:hypothetical protein
LHRRQQQAHKNPNDRDDHQEFYEREAMDIPTLHEKNSLKNGEQKTPPRKTRLLTLKV